MTVNKVWEIMREWSIKENIVVFAEKRNQPLAIGHPKWKADQLRCKGKSISWRLQLNGDWFVINGWVQFKIR